MMDVCLQTENKTGWSEKDGKKVVEILNFNNVQELKRIYSHFDCAMNLSQGKDPVEFPRYCYGNSTGSFASALITPGSSIGMSRCIYLIIFRTAIMNMDIVNQCKTAFVISQYSFRL